MKNSIILTILIMVATVSLAQSFQKEVPADYGYIVKLGDIVPDFELNLPDGTKTNIRALREKVVMIQFTASWCGVCRKEMPHIESDIWKKHRNNPNFALYGIDLKEEKDKILEFQKQTGVSYPIALDPEGKIFYTFAAQGAGVTRNIIIDKNGKMVYMTRLYKKKEFNEMKKIIEELLKN